MIQMVALQRPLILAKWNPTHVNILVMKILQSLEQKFKRKSADFCVFLSKNKKLHLMTKVYEKNIAMLIFRPYQ